jgi:hypothetical protein
MQEGASIFSAAELSRTWDRVWRCGMFLAARGQPMLVSQWHESEGARDCRANDLVVWLAYEAYDCVRDYAPIGNGLRPILVPPKRRDVTLSAVEERHHWLIGVVGSECLLGHDRGDSEDVTLVQLRNCTHGSRMESREGSCADQVAILGSKRQNANTWIDRAPGLGIRVEIVYLAHRKIGVFGQDLAGLGIQSECIVAAVALDTLEAAASPGKRGLVCCTSGSQDCMGDSLREELMQIGVEASKPRSIRRVCRVSREACGAVVGVSCRKHYALAWDVRADAVPGDELRDAIGK